ncbi:MAG TPA: HAD-IIIA family hydrolase [Candidatus Rubrimentiphilum sp.]|nr:HAD-IIIA family hydrolase [Candidatus Rubrimentiphilum sp.]
MKICAVLFDRDGTLIENVPYNGDPKAVRPLPGAREALDKLRQAQIPLAVVSNQSGIGRGLITNAQMEAVNQRVEELLGPFDVWLHCPHTPEDNCECRKPKPKLIVDAARALGVDVACCVVVGDAESDVQAARNARAQALKIGPKRTLSEAVDEILT